MLARNLGSAAPAAGARALAALAGAPPTEQLSVFDGPLKALHRDRAARLPLAPDPLVDVVADRLLDRLEDCRRTFERAVILGGAGAKVAERLAGGRAGIQEIIHVDTSLGMLERARSHAEASSSGRAHPPTRYVHWQPDSEVLPLEPASADRERWLSAASACTGHALKPDGLFLAAMFGGQTLQELRIACTVAQQEREGGVSARVSPLAQVRDGGNLLTRAGLAIPAVDVDEVQVHYRDPMQLVEHLRSMGESNALLKRRLGLPRSVALATAAAYTGLFAEEDGSIPATYEVIYMTGWAPHPSQQQAAKRGSATVSFEDLVADLGTEGDGGSGGSSGGSSGGVSGGSSGTLPSSAP
ncbi:hypothetical protein COHA_004004 [Chlorella ohadii]|uniref:Uncharacterized protein n=1 Tax=Chlorella ohadii TaxID=2649997 RepID=A0AAD5DR03_9CHLO|nr:hypothetical protein COHA_004004 [Chlorella ohadii]